tara:strand:- start:581 stop:886 length:306 start_codon:yes stop_codon:yes gene_type:complete
MKNIYFLFFALFFLSSCGGLKDAGKVLRNEKITTTDEFLVKKKRPLVLPPDYQKLPKPGELNQSKGDETENIKKILKVPKEGVSKNSSSSTEKSILNKIRK